MPPELMAAVHGSISPFLHRRADFCFSKSNAICSSRSSRSSKRRTFPASSFSPSSLFSSPSPSDSASLSSSSSSSSSSFSFSSSSSFSSTDPLHEEDAALSLDLETISSEEQFEAAMLEASSPKIINWMAAWCRKCIYLKPKLEKLAAEYPGVKFYCVDVNSVPQTLVRRADVTRMPTIQLWKDGEKYGEVIGGHKAWLVINEVREMLQNHNIQ